MIDPQYPIPSATELICLTETELLAKEYPAVKKVERIYWEPIPGEQIKPIPVPGLEHFYITDHGRVCREHFKKNGRVIKTEIKGTWKNGYKTVLVTSPVKYHFVVSRMMLQVFNPHPRYYKMQCVALDGSPSNMMLANWKWMKTGEANQYRRSIGESRPRTKTKEVLGRYGTYTKSVVYDDNDIKEIERLIQAGISTNKIAEIFQMTNANVSVIKKKMPKDAGAT